MNITNAMVASGAVVTVGQWSLGKPLDIKVVIGAAGTAVGLSFLPDQIASKLAGLILLTTVLTYVPNIAWKAGLIPNQPPAWGAFGFLAGSHSSTATGNVRQS